MNKIVYVVLRNEDWLQEIRGIFQTEEGAHDWIVKDIAASNGEWKWSDFVIQQEDLQE